MDLLQPIIKPYAWGSRDALARLQGRNTPSAGPEAELWMGAHPSGAAGTARGGQAMTLLDVVAEDPHRELGAACVRQFGGRLPFLLKVLAAEQPLSIQVHPDREQARSAFTAQQAEGGGGPYADDWPKPELLYTLGRFEVLAGFRDREEAAHLLENLEVDGLRPVIGLLRAGSDGQALSEALRAVLERTPDERAPLVSAVVAACRRLAGTTGSGSHAAAYAAVERMSRHHPEDLGLVASLLLNHRVLEPGTALFMPAGALHAYLHGVGLELLANSDNVLRAGLTAKEVNVPELLRTTDPTVRVPVVTPTEVAGPGPTWLYDCPAREFALYRTELDGSGGPLVPTAGPRIAFCAQGSARLSTGDAEQLRLGAGDSCFLPASDEDVLVEGRGTLFVAAVGLSPDEPASLVQGSLPH
ncbi:mannose-6-phosphate isomerase, class I [Streptomyces sp. NPDC005876]|uniref:mannose-6-phosphate isomerase, class I n=1 Tax=Streptomyces sp. NPDC005876 TaxID=3157076 RepID=UPI0033D651E7